MGADLILAWADLPPAGLDLGPAIDAVPEDRLAAVWESLHGELPDETEDLDWRAETRAQLHEALDDLDMPRDVVTLQVHGHDILVGGGTSWGDCPEGWDAVAAIATSGIGQDPAGPDRCALVEHPVNGSPDLDTIQAEYRTLASPYDEAWVDRTVDRLLDYARLLERLAGARADGWALVREGTVPPWMEHASVWDVPGEAGVVYEGEELLPKGARPLYRVADPTTGPGR